MFERFASDTRTSVEAARKEAQAAGVTAIEAEHLLLALSRRPEARKLGLDHDEIADALALEEERSLAAVGIDRSQYDLTGSAARGDAKLGTSAKLAIERALRITAKRGQRRLTALNLLLGVISAEHGRVPRALELAGIDIHELRARL
ncbi:Clp protease N-terminal domain-containing protein [Conexibacter sp. S30A1]|jgi:ATP-dependent Clp protease ATP-binding subunit ClpA|uniref:Clp protease N-terminal domain-containing protein n=1 Tax=Conexibacter sp. S30A1 TaxID=2937800 RepID=UPI00200F17E8|nr:Clp protease N-terminal domain-containing protein [Conexibacter sp. S30A1]